MKKILTAVIILALVGFMAYRLYANKEKNAQEVAIVAQKEAQVAVRAAKVTQENVSDLFTANGTFVAEQDLNVSSETGGQIVKIYVKEGDYVKAGQVLATTKADRTNVQLDNAKAILETAKSDLKRFESAYQTGGVTARQLEQAQLQVKNAQANYNSAAIVSGNTSVKSKISGIVSSKEVEEGTLVNPGQPLFNVVNIDNLKLKITVDEAQVSKLKVGQTIEVKPSTSSETVEGKIVFIAPKSNGALKFPVEILVANKDKKLKAGMYASAQFAGQTEATIALVVPHSAFVGSVSQNKIFKIVAGKDDQGKAVPKAELVTVKSGRNFGDKVEILEGLVAGDQVITSGQINIDNGTAVKIVE
ncbi:efflux RND transporter periplasmic adaptor subunit [Capnocytophaga gingivalis]